MPHEPVRLREAQTWLAIAAKDLRRMEALWSLAPPDGEGALFFCQQSAEKALKAFLVWNNAAFRKTHDLDEVGRLCLSVDATLAELIDRAQWLTVFASRFRYPGAAYVPDAEEVDSAMATAREVFNAVLERLPADARP
jgi:HEPN domain-containing protein